jgi:two-component system sensor histidine kinase MtrB
VQAHELGMLIAAAWRRSLQLRVVTSTLALSSAVVLVLGLVLQSEIAERLLQSKLDAAISQSDANRQVLEGQLASVDPDREGVQETLDTALERLTDTTGPGRAGTAGEFSAALTTGSANGPEVSAGDVGQITARQQDITARGSLDSLNRQYTTVDGVPEPRHRAEDRHRGPGAAVLPAVPAQR